MIKDNMQRRKKAEAVREAVLVYLTIGLLVLLGVYFGGGGNG